jgi:hypothetical protein
LVKLNDQLTTKILTKSGGFYFENLIFVRKNMNYYK